MLGQRVTERSGIIVTYCESPISDPLTLGSGQAPGIGMDPIRGGCNDGLILYGIQ